MTKQEFIKLVWRLLEKDSYISVLDAVLEIANRNGIDPESVGKIVSGNQQLKQLLEQQASKLNLLVK